MLHHKKISTVRDKLWLWAHEPGVHHPYNLPGKSIISPAEAARYMGIRNLLMVRFDKYPIPPYDELAASFADLDQVIWSLVGAGGHTSPQERHDIFELAKKYPVIKGFILDDFWSGGPEGNGGIVLSLDELKNIHQKAKEIGLDIWCVLYIGELFRKGTISLYLDYIDRFSLWSWYPEHLNKFEGKIKLFEELIPNKPRYMGVYMWDYGRKEPMPLDIVIMQCEKGLQLLKSKRLEGMIFLASCVCDLKIEAVEWIRQWIADVQNIKI